MISHIPVLLSILEILIHRCHDPQPTWSKTSTGNAEYQPHTAEHPKILCLGFNMYELFKEFYYLQLIVCVCTYSVILYHFFMLTAVMFRYISLALNACS